MFPISVDILLVLFVKLMLPMVVVICSINAVVDKLMVVVMFPSELLVAVVMFPIDVFIEFFEVDVTYTFAVHELLTSIVKVLAVVILVAGDVVLVVVLFQNAVLELLVAIVKFIVVMVPEGVAILLVFDE